jgi:hypothetical protein
MPEDDDNEEADAITVGATTMIVSMVEETEFVSTIIMFLPITDDDLDDVRNKLCCFGAEGTDADGGAKHDTPSVNHAMRMERNNNNEDFIFQGMK